MGRLHAADIQFNPPLRWALLCLGTAPLLAAQSLDWEPFDLGQQYKWQSSGSNTEHSGSTGGSTSGSKAGSETHAVMGKLSVQTCIVGRPIVCHSTTAALQATLLPLCHFYS